MAVIDITNLTVKYGSTVILDSLSERIEHGELYTIVGASGSGKTTLIKAIAGLSMYDSGTITVDGQDISKFTTRQMLQYHQNTGLVFQNAALVNSMSIFENLSLYYEFHTDMNREEISKHISPVLSAVGFSDDLSNRPSTLSTGEKMLVSIARAISHDPDIILWDQPFSSLDAISARRVHCVFMEQKQKKKTMILVTNDARFALEVSDRIGILHYGKIIECGTPDMIRNSELDITRQLFAQS